MPVGADTPEQSHLFFGGALDLSRGEPAAMRSVPDAITATPVRLSWHGELGPGLAVSIAVHADADPPAPANAPAARIWRARLRLELPQLGVIDAEVALRDNACAITCRAASTASAALLQNAAAELGGVLVDAGLRLERFAAHA
jgi:hypothetical protein